jgi:hypothetical protein
MLKMIDIASRMQQEYHFVERLKRKKDSLVGCTKESEVSFLSFNRLYG